MIVKPNEEMREAIRKKHRQNKEIIISENFSKIPFNYTVAEKLITHVIDNQTDPVITYEQLAFKISDDFNPRNLREYLGNISCECKANDLPPISSIVVLKGIGLPGDGFYREFYSERPMSEWEDIFKECKQSVIECDFWQNLLDAIA